MFVEHFRPQNPSHSPKVQKVILFYLTTMPKIESLSELIQLKTDSKNHFALLFFTADWIQQNDQITQAAEEVCASFLGVTLYTIDAEEADDCSEHFDISVAPTFVLVSLSNPTKALGSVKGAIVSNIMQLVLPHCTPKQVQKSGQTTNKALESASKIVEEPSHLSNSDNVDDASIRQELKTIIESHPIFMVIKGTKDQPKCKFSRALLSLLKEHVPDLEFETLNILEHPEFRERIKKMYEWKTFPMIFINGELQGGLDIMKSLAASNQLSSLFSTTGPQSSSVSSKNTDSGDSNPSEETEEQLFAKCDAFIKSAPMVLFMKGTPQAPECGFSARVVKALNAAKANYTAYNILLDEKIRQTLKKHVDWKTYPMLFVNGELVGGCDIVETMAKDGSLDNTVKQLLQNETA